MAKKDSKSVLKKKKKTIFTIVAPKILNEVVIGDTYAYNAESLIGRTVEANLMNLTMDMRKQQYKVKFMIVDVDGTTARTKPIAYTMINASVKRLVRRNRDKVDDSFTTYTRDKVFIRIKPLLITLNNVSASIRSALRKSTREYIIKFLEEHNYNTFIRDIISGVFQRELMNFLKKIYPMRTVEIRTVKIEKFKQKIKTKESEVLSQVMSMEETVSPKREMPERPRRKRRVQSK